MANQLFFDFYKFDAKKFYSAEDFIIFNENLSANNLLNKFFSYNNFFDNPYKSMILTGDSKSGKTHLAHIFCQKFSSIFLTNSQIFNENPFNFFKANQFYIIDDFDQIENSQYLLQIINSAYESQALLLLIGNPNTTFDLPDLNSRLKNIFVTQINQTSIENLQIIFSTILSRKQIFLKKNIIDKIFLKIKPNYANIYFATQIIESYFNQNDKKLSLEKIANFFDN
jgi:chromosomal replication initiation ATPase DnaA